MITMHNPGANIAIVTANGATLYFSYSTLIAAEIGEHRMRGPSRSKTTASHMTKLRVKAWSEYGASEKEFSAIVENAMNGNPPA